MPPYSQGSSRLCLCTGIWTWCFNHMYVVDVIPPYRLVYLRWSWFGKGECLRCGCRPWTDVPRAVMSAVSRVRRER